MTSSPNRDEQKPSQSPTNHWWSRIETHEITCVAWAFVWFFFILLSYFTVRPIRETMGIEGGTKQLPHLFLITFLAMLLAVPVYSAVVARLPRRWVVRVVYHFFTACLLVFWALLQVESELVKLWTARVIFIWVNVFALFATSVFWSVLADLFTSNQGKRLFGVIAAGGTLGAISGSLVATLVAGKLSTGTLLLLPAGLLQLGLCCAWRLEIEAHKLVDPEQRDREQAKEISDTATGGGLLSGITQVIQTPYLASICLYLLLVQIFGTQFYLQQADIVNDQVETTEQRVQLFAMMDLGTQLLTLVVQMFLAGPFLRRLGIRFALGFLPLVYGAGFALLAIQPTLAVMVGVAIVARASLYGVTVPSREVLFTVVSREQKYKSKSFIDTVVMRGGDAIAGQMFAGLQSTGLSLTSMNWYAVPLTGAWLLAAWRLGARQESRSKQQQDLIAFND